ncbi:MAG: DUF2797 domain-containing protein, partial [Bdellovibrionales bacterium]|nr:DUF2797 domain-containing protein [Bdellovibrionales bacterium]
MKIFLRKLQHSGQPLLRYSLAEIQLNDLLEKQISLSFSGQIQCVTCGISIKKSFNQGYCYNCFRTLARCDLCLVKPETCHFRKGTCREPEWGREQCLVPHVVYLSNTTGLKVGITRKHKLFERWGDQGAVCAVAICEVPERYYAGLIEVALKAQVSDRTDWRKLIKGERCEVDLLKEAERLVELLP